jgi:hypothetical protein
MASRGGITVLSGNVAVKRTKVIFKGGVNPASGSLPAGSQMNIVHSPKGGIKRYG